jgi:acetyl-CoA C-acetyltransferase
MPTPTPLIAAWTRSAVVPRGGAFKALQPHDLAAPVLKALLAQAGVDAAAVDAVVLGNALGAGGNPARMLALHAGLLLQCAAYTVDTQCCAGLDAVAMGAALIASGQAHVVVAGGVEAWSTSPIRMHRPLQANDSPVAYERPAFAPTPEQDPDMLLSAARYAAAHGYTRAEQEAYALHSHEKAVAHQAHMEAEIVAVADVAHDAYPRVIDAARAQRMPVVARSDQWAVKDANTNADADVKTDAGSYALTALTISAQADGAALVLLVSHAAAARFNLRPKATWAASASVGGAPEWPMLCAELAARQALVRAGIDDASRLKHVELHDAFAVQGMSFAKGLGLKPALINQQGGGLARGHPIGASGAIALVRLLADLSRAPESSDYGLVAVAGAGGLGSAAVVQT